MKKTIGNDDFVHHFARYRTKDSDDYYSDILINNITYKGMYELFNKFEKEEESRGEERELEDVANEIESCWFQYESFNHWFEMYDQTNMSTNIKTVEDLEKAYEMVQLYSYEDPTKKEEIIVCYP
jgi:hypothetical protein